MTYFRAITSLHLFLKHIAEAFMKKLKLFSSWVSMLMDYLIENDPAWKRKGTLEASELKQTIKAINQCA